MSVFQIHYFASASSYTKKPTESLPAPCPLSKLFNLLEERYPGIKDKVLSSCVISLNMEYVDMDESDDGKGIMIEEGDEVAVIPPVSSG
ncbi:hypothetical protein KEM55_006919 [Ascosphaera atra]|nr:hypothetical protein KEM55_006919 [Ascosphaera atra]